MRNGPANALRRSQRGRCGPVELLGLVSEKGESDAMFGIRIARCTFERAADGSPQASVDLLLEPYGLLIRHVLVVMDGELGMGGVVFPGSIAHIDGATITEDNLSFLTEWDRMSFTSQVLKALSQEEIVERFMAAAMSDPVGTPQ